MFLGYFRNTLINCSGIIQAVIAIGKTNKSVNTYLNFDIIINFFLSSLEYKCIDTTLPAEITPETIPIIIAVQELAAETAATPLYLPTIKLSMNPFNAKKIDPKTIG